MLRTYYNNVNCVDYVNNVPSYDFKQVSGRWD